MRPLIKQPTLTDPLDIIVKGCRESDMQCQEQLYRHCYPEMIKVCQRYAGDMDGAGLIFNNAMLRVFKNIHTYKEEGKLLGWVRTIVVNCCLDFIKQQYRFNNLTIDPILENETTVDADALSHVSAKEIRTMIAQLPRATATVFNLYVYEGFTHKQIAAGLGISEGTSKWHVNEARKSLKTKLENFRIKTNAAG